MWVCLSRKKCPPGETCAVAEATSPTISFSVLQVKVYLLDLSGAPTAARSMSHFELEDGSFDDGSAEHDQMMQECPACWGCVTHPNHSSPSKEMIQPCLHARGWPTLVNQSPRSPSPPPALTRTLSLTLALTLTRAELHGGAGCTPSFVPGKLHFKNKFCDNCRSCIMVPVAHVRALSAEQAACFVNKRSEVTFGLGFGLGWLG